ncbi:MAG: extracellular solute-binding protein [Cyanobacteria bacterium K_DeepCast_35m_m2_023]|nr:extracellular solute-binding protein [Cyanobacteria bacterium K_DeepCast_35m_m2_023]
MLRRTVPLLGALLLSLAGPTAAQSQEVRVYSGRHYSSDNAIYERFTKATGIKVRLLESNDSAIVERLRSEGLNSSADVLILVDAAKLANATELGLFQPIGSAELMRDVPLSLRDPKGRWFGLTRRVRAFAVNPKLVNPASLKTYADLAKPALRGKLCLRNRASVYNQSLVADQLILRGEPATRAWIRGMVANLADEVYTSDTVMARDVARAICGVGVLNSYYVARMLSGQTGSADRDSAQKLRIIYPNPVHVNVSGAGVTRHAKNRSQAIRLIEFLTSSTAAEGFAQASFEYPLQGFGNNPILSRFGTFTPDGLSAAQLGAKAKAAVKLMADNGWQ